MGSVGSSCCDGVERRCHAWSALVSAPTRTTATWSPSCSTVSGDGVDVVVTDELHVVRLQQLVDRARRRVERDLLVVDRERAADAGAVHDRRAGGEATGVVAHRGELAELQLLRQLVGAGLDGAHGAHGAVDVDGDRERAQHVDVEAVVQRAGRGAGTTTSPGPSCTCAAASRAPTESASVRTCWRVPSTTSVTSEPDGAVACWTIQAPPSAVSTTRTATPSTRGAGRKRVRRRRRGGVPAGGPSSSRSVTGRELLGAGERQPGGGVVGLGPGRRRRRARLGHREGVGHDGLGLGHDRGLVLGVGVEERVDRREVVDVVGSGSHAAASCGLGPRGRRRHQPLRCRFESISSMAVRSIGACGADATCRRADTRSTAARADRARGTTSTRRAVRRARATVRSRARRARATADVAVMGSLVPPAHGREDAAAAR